MYMYAFNNIVFVKKWFYYTASASNTQLTHWRPYIIQQELGVLCKKKKKTQNKH